MAQKLGVSGSLIGGIIATIVASVCCVGPLLLITLGIGGAWVAQLTLFEAVRPLFIVVSVAFLGFAFHRLYFAPQVCKPGTICADPKILKRQRAVYWVVSILLLGLLATPWVASFFL